jgi:hypothetical protein
MTKAYPMTELEKERVATVTTGGARTAEDARLEASRSGLADVEPSTPEGEATPGPERCAPDAIPDGDGHYLEPPD